MSRIWFVLAFSSLLSALLPAAAQDPLVSGSKNTYTAVLCFTGVSHCAPCRRLEQTWSSPEVLQFAINNSIPRLVLDDSAPNAGQYFQAWGVSGVPTTVLVEMDIETQQVVKIYRHTVGYMSPQQLVQFMDPLQ